MSFLSGIKGFKNKLIRIGTKEPLNFFSILIILGLDLFVLVNIFQGLDLQTRQMVSPGEKIPYECRDLVNVDDPKKQETTILDILGKYNNFYENNSYKYREEFINTRNKEKIDSMCREVFDAANDLRENSSLQTKKSQIDSIQKESDSYQMEIDQYENSYDTMLLEEIANQPDNNSIINGKADDVKLKIRNLNNAISSNNLRIKKLTEEIMREDEVKSFLAIASKNKEPILEKNKKLKFWYPLKKTGVEFLFLLPLLIFFIYLYRRSLKKNSELMILITAHLLVVVSIPILFEVIRLLLDVLPFHILEDVLQLLESLNLIVIWNYLLILLGIGVTIGLIYFIQKKLFSRERLYLKRIAKGRCFSCGVKIKDGSTHCYNCGEAQDQACPSCKKKTFKTGIHCVNCGINIKAFTETKEDN